MDYDALIVGGGINGLACAGYLARAGAKVAVLEARVECGAHCNTEEVTGGGFLHNLHATWLITAVSPAMEDLELERFGLEIVTTDYAYGKVFADGKCALLGLNPQDTYQNWQKLSPRDGDFILKVSEVMLAHWNEVLDQVHTFLFTPPDITKLEGSLTLLREIQKTMDIPIPPEDFLTMNGFEALDWVLGSEYTKTLIASLAWIGGFPPIHRKIGASTCLGLVPLAGPVLAVHQAKGGSHALTHALIRSLKHAGVEILTNCPVAEILVDERGAYGVRLGEEAVFPSRIITARKIISDLSFRYTIERIAPDRLSPFLRMGAKLFCYDEQVIFGVHYALKDAPTFSSHTFDPGIQRCFMGYMGGETLTEMKQFAVELVSGVIPSRLMANWFVPTLADPSQAPEGHHTAFVWLDVPPIPRRWGDRNLPYRFTIWDEIKWELTEAVTDLFERYAPGFKDLILDIFPYSPLDIYRNNPSAIKGNWNGGSLLPDQFYNLRPLPFVMKEGSASRTIIPNLYLSNSIHPHGATWLASGYLSAREVAEDLNCDVSRAFRSKSALFYVSNLHRFPRNLGVPARWQTVQR